MQAIRRRLCISTTAIGMPPDVSQSSHGGTVPCVDGQCRRSSQRASANEVHNISSVGMCTVMYPWRVARCHQNAL
eukprot:6621656-Prymnesium_polylepis.1